MISRRQFWLSACCAAGLRAQDEPVFTADARDVRVDTSVTNMQRPVTGLRADEFLLLENEQPQPIRAVATEELPLDLVLIFQPVPQSGVRKESIQIVEATRARMLNGASNVLLLTRPSDRVAFLTHTDPPRIELPFTSDREEIGAALRRMGSLEHYPGAWEQLTIEYAVRMLAELGPSQDRRRLILRLGTLSLWMPYADEPVIRRLWSENIIFSSIEILLPAGGFNPGFRIPEDAPKGAGFGSKEPDGPLYRVSNPNHIAQATGGDAIGFLDPQNPRDLITRMRQRYVLWFRQPEGLEPGQERKISVELSPEVRLRYPEAVVQARAGYVTR